MTQIQPDAGCVVVTGAGSGLGRALSVQFAQDGFAVAGTGRRADALAQTQTLCPDGRFMPVVMDVSDGDAVDAGFDQIRAQMGSIAILINNAAIYPRADFLEAGPQSFMTVMDINLGGIVRCSHAALRDMAERGAGRILNVSSYADLTPLPASSAYSVSKGAGRILTRALVADLADRFPDIVISDWMPGMLKTTMGIPEGLDPSQAAIWGAKLARLRDPSLTGTVFEMNREILPPRGLKGRIKDAITGKRRKARMV